MRRQHGARVRRDRAFDRSRAQRERGRIDVGEHRRQAGDAGDLRNDPERQRRNDDLGAGRQVHRLEDEVERHPPVLGRARAHVARPEQPRELLLERLDVRSLDELLAVAALLDDLLQFRNHPGAKSCDSGHCSSTLVVTWHVRPRRASARRSMHQPLVRQRASNDPNTERTARRRSAPFQPPSPNCARNAGPNQPTSSEQRDRPDKRRAAGSGARTSAATRRPTRRPRRARCAGPARTGSAAPSASRGARTRSRSGAAFRCERRIARHPPRQPPAKHVEVRLVADRRAERPGDEHAERVQLPCGHQRRRARCRRSRPRRSPRPAMPAVRQRATARQIHASASSHRRRRPLHRAQPSRLRAPALDARVERFHQRAHARRADAQVVREERRPHVEARVGAAEQERAARRGVSDGCVNVGVKPSNRSQSVSVIGGCIRLNSGVPGYGVRILNCATVEPSSIE